MGFFDSLFGREKAGAGAGKPVSGQQEYVKLMQDVEVLPGLHLPSVLASQWDLFERKKLPVINIEATPAGDLKLEDSKFGGYPILPVEFAYPVDADGRPLFLLAQINCSELPSPNPYPDSGYLQFYIPGFDELWGLEHKQGERPLYRVVYHSEEQSAEYVADLSFLKETMAAEMLPFHGSLKLSFNPSTEYFGFTDHRCSIDEFKLPDAGTYGDQLESDIDDVLAERFPSSGHRMGGYAYFTQEDPRIYNEAISDYVLLLQIDSDDTIMWGDVGVANFFIHPDDLAKKDFTKVFFTWDCC